MRTKFIFLLGFILICAGCGSIINQSKVVLDKDTVMTLSRTVCYGTCPQYTVTINGQGEVMLAGSKMVRTDGNIVKQDLDTKRNTISRERLEQLVAEFNKINYLSLNGNYKEQGTDCPSYATDNPHAITSITANGKTKTIDHYLGCEGSATLKDLTALERKIDETANTKDWLK